MPHRVLEHHEKEKREDAKLRERSPSKGSRQTSSMLSPNLLVVTSKQASQVHARQMVGKNKVDMLRLSKGYGWKKGKRK